MLLVFAGLAVVVLDQAVKFWVVQNIPLGSAGKVLIPGVLSLTRVHNDGAAFSFLSGGNAKWFFIVLSLGFAAAVIAAVSTGFIRDKTEKVCLVMMAAGGLANCVDRFLYGYVVDMFKVELFHFAVFNVADAFITVFTLLFAAKVLLSDENKKKS